MRGGAKACGNVEAWQRDTKRQGEADRERQTERTPRGTLVAASSLGLLFVASF